MGWSVTEPPLRKIHHETLAGIHDPGQIESVVTKNVSEDGVADELTNFVLHGCNGFIAKAVSPLVEFVPPEPNYGPIGTAAQQGSPVPVVRQDAGNGDD